MSKYNEIVVLVHPLYNLLMSKSGVPVEMRTHLELLELTDLEIRNQHVKQYLENIIKNKENAFQLKHSLQAYGEEILKYKDKPETLVVVFLPVSPSAKVMTSVFNAIGGRFIEFCKKTLGNRFLVERSLNTLYDRNILKKLSKNLRIKAFGEYKNICVKEYSDSLSEYLINRDFNVRTETIYEKSLEKGAINRGALKKPKEFRSLDNRVIYKKGREANRIARQEKKLKHSVAK